MNLPKCPVCNKEAEIVGTLDIYPNRFDLSNKIFYRCPEHTDYYVGSHANGTPLGILANKELRLWKQRCHQVFDPHWQESKSNSAKRTARVKYYSRLSIEMGLSVEETHIGMFDIEKCRKAYNIIRKWQ